MKKKERRSPWGNIAELLVDFFVERLRRRETSIINARVKVRENR